LVCAYKPNIAFYEKEGTAAEIGLERTVKYIHDQYPDIPVIGDNKVGDIGSTSEAYAKKLFGRYNFDAVTVSPYLGREAVKPLLDYRDRGIIVVCRTSNPGGGEFQDLDIPIDRFTTDTEEKIELMKISGGTTIPLYLAVAARAIKWNRETGNISLVIGAQYPEEAEKVRKLDSDIQFLIPGIGRQGGDLKKAVAASIGTGRGRIMINSSSGITSAPRLEITPTLNESAGSAANREAAKLRNDILYFRDNPEGFTDSETELADALFDTGVIKFGEFKLNLHETHPEAPLSPIYVDQRVLRSAPNEIKALTAKVLTEKIRNLKYDVYADTPTAVTWLVSLMSYLNEVPMITARAGKTHGSGASVDGEYKSGKTVALAFDDVLTSGASAIQEAARLRSADVIVRDFVVLVNREQGGVQAMKNNNLTPHYVYEISDLLRYFKRTGKIDEATYERCLTYAKNNR